MPLRNSEPALNLPPDEARDHAREREREGKRGKEREREGKRGRGRGREREIDK